MQAKTIQEIAEYLNNIKFKRKLLCGVDEDDVWAVIAELQKEYDLLLESERAKNYALIDERNQMICKLQDQLKQKNEAST